MLASAPEDGDSVLAAHNLPIVHAGAPWTESEHVISSSQGPGDAYQFPLMSRSRAHAVRPKQTVSFWSWVASSVLPTGNQRKQQLLQSGNVVAVKGRC